MSSFSGMMYVVAARFTWHMILYTKIISFLCFVFNEKRGYHVERWDGAIIYKRHTDLLQYWR